MVLSPRILIRHRCLGKGDTSEHSVGTPFSSCVRCSALAATVLCHLSLTSSVKSPSFCVLVCFPSPCKFINVLKSDERSRKQQMVRLRIALRATAPSKVYLVKVLSEASVLCAHCQEQEDALGAEADGLMLLHEGTG